MDIEVILTTINNIVIGLVLSTLALQFLYSLFIFFKPKKFKPSNRLHRYGVVICAHNEEKVIENAIKSILNQDYPKELVDIFIVAHNCSDNTYNIAKKFERTTVFKYNDSNPKHQKKGYALNFVFKKLLTNEFNHSGYFIFDADCVAKKDYIKNINDAFDCGNHICQGYRNTLNFEKNCVSETNGLFHLRDCSFNSNARNFIHSSNLIIGTGVLISRKCLENTLGWNAFSLSEDLEYTIKSLVNGYNAVYVDNAEFYIEQPTSLKVSLQRQARIGKGGFKLFFKYGHQLLYRFFTTFKLKYLDIFLVMLSYPIALLCALWFPAYYMYIPLNFLIAGNMIAFQEFLMFILKIVGLYIFVPITLQNILIYLKNYKRLNLKNPTLAILTLFYFPFFNLLCSGAIAFGILNPKTKWKKVPHTFKV